MATNSQKVFRYAGKLIDEGYTRRAAIKKAQKKFNVKITKTRKKRKRKLVNIFSAWNM